MAGFEETSTAQADTVVLQKRQLRAELLAKRESEDALQRAAADALIKVHLEALPAFQAAQTIFCYISMGAEVDTLGLLKNLLASGKTVCVPRCEGKAVMRAHVLTDMNELHEGVLGILAPPADAPLLEPADLDLIVVPCLACDSSGFRIGYGGAYYDRYLGALPSGARATTVALCRESLLLEQVPRESHDIPVDIVVTDKGVVFCNPAE
ncbi:MAG: 5-formyltetrahydrofolate cyclo-ligase [Coriobacteriia bacterium]|nr:5-formyltetrahydrofolate cyclo-ligase [Coriobacteriia bacterium]MCL2750696.1 5-formyltetrahydrofolate cyclo-ligase [Coriobacteriia bacterium]